MRFHRAYIMVLLGCNGCATLLCPRQPSYTELMGKGAQLDAAVSNGTLTQTEAVAKANALIAKYKDAQDSSQTCHEVFQAVGASMQAVGTGMQQYAASQQRTNPVNCTTFCSEYICNTQCQ